MVEFFLENQTPVCTKKRGQKLHNWLCNVHNLRPEYPLKNQIEITHDSRSNTRFHELELEHTQAQMLLAVFKKTYFLGAFWLVFLCNTAVSLIITF